MKARDDMKEYCLDYENHKYYYRILDAYISTKDGKKHSFRIPVSLDGFDGQMQMICFSLDEDNLSEAEPFAEKKIKEEVDKLKLDGKEWGKPF